MKTQIYPLPSAGQRIGIFGVIALGIAAALVIMYFKNRNNETEESK